VSGRSHTGVWAVRCGDDELVCGPFDGKTPAEHYAKSVRDRGFPAKAFRLQSPVNMNRAIALRARDVAAQRAMQMEYEQQRSRPCLTPPGPPEWKGSE